MLRHRREIFLEQYIIKPELIRTSRRVSVRVIAGDNRGLYTESINTINND